MAGQHIPKSAGHKAPLAPPVGLRPTIPRWPPLLVGLMTFIGGFWMVVFAVVGYLILEFILGLISSAVNGNMEAMFKLFMLINPGLRLVAIHLRRRWTPPREKPLLSRDSNIIGVYAFIAFVSMTLCFPDAHGDDQALFNFTVRIVGLALAGFATLLLLQTPHVDTFVGDDGPVFVETTCFSRRTTAMPDRLYIQEQLDSCEGVYSAYFFLCAETPDGIATKLACMSDRAKAEAAREKILAALESRRRPADSAPKPPAGD